MGSASQTGNFAERSLPALLAQLHAERFSGRLGISLTRQEKSFLFQDGLPIYAESNRASGGLAAQLVASGQISAADRERLAEYMQREKCKEGTALLALELLEPKALMEAMRDQVQSNLLDCFGWSKADFSLDPEEQAPAGSQMFRPDLYALLLEGVSTHWSPDQILTELAPRMQLFPRANDAVGRIREQIGSDEIVLAYLHALDGTRPLWEVLQKAATPRAMATAWVVDAVGAVDYADEPRANGEAEANDGPPEIEIVVEGAGPSAAKSQRAAADKTDARKKAAAGNPELEQKIGSQFEQLSSLDYYELLGVERTADVRDIKRAYLVAAKTYHPDALARSGVSEEVREQASKVFAEIGKAHAQLSDPRRRREYDTREEDDSASIDADRLAGAEMLFRKGEILLRSGNFKGALEFLKPAVEAWPDEGVYQGALGWALFKKQPPEPDAAREHLQRAVQLSPEDGLQWQRLSLVLRGAGETEQADEALATAKTLDPSLA